MSDLKQRIQKARAPGAPEALERARRGLLAWLSAKAQGAGVAQARMGDGTAAVGIGQVALSATPLPDELACQAGCAFCCILNGEDGGTISEAEARGLHAALAPHAGTPDGRAWHASACAALDPDTRMCRAYDARPMICRSYASTDVSACESVANGTAAPGPGTFGAYHTYLAALGLSRAALKGKQRLSTYAMARVTAAAVEGKSLEDTLGAARHKPAELEHELRRSKRDSASTNGPR